MPYEITPSDWEEEDWEEHSYGPDRDMSLEESQAYLDGHRQPQTVYISGYEDLIPTEFREHYEAPLLESIDRGETFIMAGSNGNAEMMALRYLRSKHVEPERIIMYRVLSEYQSMTPSHFGCIVKQIDGSKDDRDEALTCDSHGDILWLRSQDKRMLSTLSASACLDARFDVTVLENKRRRAAQGIERCMKLYDELA